MHVITLIILATIFAFSSGWSLTAQQKDFYENNGYLIIENFIETEECDTLHAKADELVQQRGAEAAREIFSTTHQGKCKDEFFFKSANNISFFFEPKAFDSQGNLKVDISHAINKMGHNMHNLDPAFIHFSNLPQIHEVVKDLGVVNPELMQSMYIFKQPFIGGEVTCHQDGTFLFTEPDTTVGLWFAIEDANLENGCLWAIPGGHVSPLKSRFVKTAEGGTGFEVYDKCPWNLSEKVPLEVKKGSLIVLHSRVPHMSEMNCSSKSRHAYTLHFIDKGSNYPKDNWLQKN